MQGDLLAPIPAERPIDLVVSNPPYIPSSEIDGLQPEVSVWEPRLALDGGPDGLAAYRRLVPQVAARARRALLLEVGHDQAAQVTDLLRRAKFSNLESWKDLAGLHRVVGGRTPLNVEEQTSLKL